MAYTYRIWDKTGPLNGVDAPVAMEALRIREDDEVYIVLDDTGRDWVVQTQANAPYPGATIEESAANHLAALEADRPELTDEQAEALRILGVEV